MRSKKLSLVVVPVLLSACSHNNTLHQDVYSQQYDCLHDWIYALCEPEQSDQWQSGNGLYIGPQYYKNNRKVRFQGKVVKPTGKRATHPPKVSTQIIPYAKSTPIRGGFGRFSSSGGG